LPQYDCGVGQLDRYVRQDWSNHSSVEMEYNVKSSQPASRYMHNLLVSIFICDVT